MSDRRYYDNVPVQWATGHRQYWQSLNETFYRRYYLANLESYNLASPLPLGQTLRLH